MRNVYGDLLVRPAGGMPPLPDTADSTGVDAGRGAVVPEVCYRVPVPVRYMRDVRGAGRPVLTAAERRVCTCTHGETAHDLSERTKKRTKCSVLLGPRGA